jgi:hypothetical protein
MQVFILDRDMEKSARYYSDKHLIKIILEAVQILCTAVNLSGGEAFYKSTHINHPCNKWCRESLSNWKWLLKFVTVLNVEKVYRYGKPHNAALMALTLPLPNIPDKGLTEFPQAMPDAYKYKDPIQAYRRYYKCEKSVFKSGPATWKNRPIPFFMENA